MLKLSVTALAASVDGENVKPQMMRGGGLRSDQHGISRRRIYSVVQGIERSTWVWTVRLRDGEINTGSARSKPAAADDAERTINKALAPN
jgi:hypothetical protein